MTRNPPSAPSAHAIGEAARLLEPYRIRTPLVRLNGHTGPGEIWLKLENLQTIGAYKVRSVGNILLNARPDDLTQGVYTASSGNSGLAVAWMAQQLGVPARVYVTPDSPAAKLDAIRRCGATIRELDHDTWWTVIENRGHPDDPGLYADAVRDPLALAGNATIGDEIAEDLDDVDTVVLPFGGGGVLCGTAAGLRRHQPSVRTLAAESEASTPATAALQAGKPVTAPMQPSYISGVGAPFVLAEMWPLVRDSIDATCVLPVDAVSAAIRHLVRHNHIVAEGAGALPVAAAMAGHAGTGRIVCVVTGGNLDTDVLADILLGKR